MQFPSTVSKWSVFEVSLKGTETGNPYLDVELSGRFSQGNRVVTVPGFYDGDGTYKVRFMPDNEGAWRFETVSSDGALDGKTGDFSVGPADAGNHGPVRVAHRYHFAHEDGTPYFPLGTTCYAWTHQPLDEQEKTLETLRQTKFNKMRMCVFPKDYPYNHNEPLHDVYLPKANGEGQDCDRPNFEAFRHFENQVKALGDMGIQADIIIFHPYDRWGYCMMSEAQDFRYLKYLVARLAAHHNVWWSLANEYDFLIDVKPMQRWDRFFHIIEENDPYRHPKSIHNGDPDANYDHRKPWVDHVCIQNWDVKRTVEWRDDFGKPVVNDEPEYEGNLVQSWGSITAEELVHRFWITVMRGGYAGHGETYVQPDDRLWWAKGGVLHGESYKRIGFLLDLIKEDVTTGLTPLGATPFGFPWNRVSGAGDENVTYVYFGEHQPVIWSSGFPQEDGDYEIDIIDTWNMTVTPAKKVPAPVPHPTRHGSVVRGGVADAAFGVELPGKPYLAVRVRPRGRKSA
ncbi:DUF5060 domain-containing protein [Martelella radicis]|uniref:DUF5060 domain-containing protein n=1 Tax=Martelella radicis TaxID=1397476 RepID=A0A7W6KNN7_9HYPH|nr:DUF5060 domain-containing protein [Martelella radicis]MBB4124533.1 hypothetical protein [Martelella radicis]